MSEIAAQRACPLNPIFSGKISYAFGRTSCSVEMGSGSEMSGLSSQI